MIAVGRPAAEAELGLVDSSICSGSQSCFQVSTPSRAMVGTNAGTFAGDNFCKAPCSGGSPCVVFLYEDSTGWHYVNARCAGNSGFMPGPGDEVYVPTCAYVRSAPALSASVVTCLSAGSTVDVDSAPVYADGHIWWHLACRGWMAHDDLVVPLNAAAPLPHPAPPLLPPFSPTITLTPDHGQSTTTVSFVGRCFPSNEPIGLYVETGSGQTFLSTPGPVSDANGSAQDQLSLRQFSPGPLNICGDTGYPGNSNQYAVKVCATFTIEANPYTSARITVSPDHGPPGTVVTITGSGFPPGESVRAYFSDPFMGPVGQPVSVDAQGSFVDTLTLIVQFSGPSLCVSTQVPGAVPQYDVHACAPFRVEQGPPSPTPAPTFTPEPSPTPATFPSPSASTDASPDVTPEPVLTGAKKPSFVAVQVVIGAVILVIAAAAGIWAYRRQW